MLSCYASQVIKRLKIYLPRPNLDPNNFALQKCVIGKKNVILRISTALFQQKHESLENKKATID
jgi:hypothetical protein